MAIAGLFPDQPEVGAGPAEEPAHGTVIWLWNPKWMTVEERGFINVEVPAFTIDRLLVAVGMIHSRTEAQRLIKQGAVSWRRDDNVMDWTKVKEWKQELEPSWPWVLRISDGHWRSVMVEERPDPDKPPVSKPKAFPGLALVMRPEENQTRDVWTDLWK